MVSYALLFSLPVVLVGAWYLVNPQTVSPLATLEGERTNRLRRLLRRVNGGVMLVSGVTLFYVISKVLWLTDEPGRRPGLALPLACIALVPLVVTMLSLALIDMRMTGKLRRRARENRSRGDDGPAVPALAAAAMLGLLIGCDEPREVAAPPEQSPAAQEDADAVLEANLGLDDGEPQDLPTVTVAMGEEPVDIELMVADDFDTRSKGLMFRREMGPREGMLFVFPDVDFRSFWMRNTYIALDIIFLDARMRVLNVGRGEPLDEESVRSSGRAKYVIELAAGRARDLGIKRGTTIELPESVRETDE